MDAADDPTWLDDLTPPQRQAVLHRDGPLLILAAAGSGKTRVITRRVAGLIAHGAEPWQVLAITFTNKAAGEMKHRVAASLGRRLHDFGRLDQRSPLICTFHSLCLRILRHYAPLIGLPPGFTVYDSADQIRVIKEALKIADLNARNFTPQTVHGTISNAKNQLVGPQEFAASSQDFYRKNVARVYTHYQRLLGEYNGLDFDDLMLRTAEAFRDHPKLLDELQERFRYILIDEYQDTNHAQYLIAHKLAEKHRNLCVVGDPDQSIYAWRGADINNILDFEKDYPDATVVRLERNYRSTQNILAIADRLISFNTRRKPKRLYSENPAGTLADFLLCQDEHDEAEQVTQRLRALHQDSGVAWNQMAVFYRMNSLSRVMEDALRRAQIPYQIARGVEFYNRREIKTVLAYLRVVANASDQVSLERIVNEPPRGLGDTSLDALRAAADARGVTLLEMLAGASGVPALSTRAANAAVKFAAMVARWKALADAPPGPGGPASTVRGVMEAVVRESGYEAAIRKDGDEDNSALANVNELISAAAEYDEQNPDGSLTDYLGQVSLVSDVDRLRDAGGAVTLMTLHAAKGLEFPVVAMIGMEEGILPHSRAAMDQEQMEEERRLCFVGITRAQQTLIFSRAAVRTLRGLRERTVGSPFLSEMPRELLQITDRTGMAMTAESFGGSPADASTRFTVGQRVSHQKFGIGRVCEISPIGGQTRAVVDFQRTGRKTLILEYANLDPIG